MNTPLLTYRGTVYPWHCDHVGHMNVMWYVGKFDEATWNLFHHIGLTPSYLRENHRGMAAVEQQIDYLRELRAGSVVTIHSRIDEVREKLIVFTHEMTNDDSGEMAARTRLKGLHLDTIHRRSCKFDPQVEQIARGLGLVDTSPVETRGSGHSG